eukprot:4824734-Prymnesium_polylepis.1
MNDLGHRGRPCHAKRLHVEKGVHVSVKDDPINVLREDARVDGGNFGPVRSTIEREPTGADGTPQEVEILRERLRAHILQEVIRAAIIARELPVARSVAGIGHIARGREHLPHCRLVGNVDVFEHVAGAGALNVRARAVVRDLGERGWEARWVNGQGRIAPGHALARELGRVGPDTALVDPQHIKAKRLRAAVSVLGDDIP